MNLSTIITRIKLKIGLLNIVTPFEDLDSVIHNILKEITIPVFSIYYPAKDTIVLNTTELELLEKQSDYEKYLLPDFKTRKLITVLDVSYDTSHLAGLGYYSGGMPIMQGNLLNQLMLGNAGAQVMNQVIPKLTFHFEGPRTVYIFNAYASTKLKFELGFMHDSTLASIPETCSEEFLKLALLDVKENLYPTMKHFSELNTVHGTINLKLDEWANAESERKELIDKWDDNYHLDLKPMYYI